MWRIHRYYLWEITLSSVLTFTVLFGIVMISTVPRGIELAQGFGLTDAMKITLLWTVDTMPHLLPISLLFATVLTYARAGQDREITALRSAGISPRVAMTPALLLGIAFSLIGSAALHYLVPQAHFAKFRVVANTVRTVLMETGMLGDKLEFSGLTMTWDRRNQRGRWENVEIVLDSEGDQFSELGGEGIVTASEAWVEMTPDGESLSLVLRDARKWGETEMFLGEPRINISIRAISDRLRRDEGNKDLATDQLLAEVYRGVHHDPLEARFIFHRRSCFALLPILFAPIGFCIGVLTRERGRMTALMFSLVPMIVAYSSDVVGENLMRDAGFSELAWLPAALLLLLGAPFCWRLLRY